MLVAQQVENLVEDILEVQEVQDHEVLTSKDHVVLELEVHDHHVINHIQEEDLHVVQVQEVLVLIDHVVFVHQKNDDALLNLLVRVQDH